MAGYIPGDDFVHSVRLMAPIDNTLEVNGRLLRIPKEYLLQAARIARRVLGEGGTMADMHAALASEGIVLLP